MKTLIVYYSLTSKNEMVAKELQKRLCCDILKIEEVKSRNEFTIFLDILFDRKPEIKDIEGSLDVYDHFIFVAPMWGPNIVSPLKTFLLRNKNSIKSYSFITVCGETAGQKEKTIRSLRKLLGYKPDIVTELFLDGITLPEEQESNSSRYLMQQKLIEAFETKITYFLKHHDASALAN